MASRPGRDAIQKKKKKKIGKLFSAITSKVNDLTRIAINVTNRIKLRK